MAYRGEDRVEVRVVQSATPKPEFDPWYLASIPGAVKSIETLSSLITFICVVLVHGIFWGIYFVQLVSIVGFVTSLILLIMYLFNLVQLVSVNWNRNEMIIAVVYGICFLLSGICMAYSAGRWKGYAAPWGASAFFAFVCVIAYAADFYMNYKAFKETRYQTPGKEIKERTIS